MTALPLTPLMAMPMSLPQFLTVPGGTGRTYYAVAPETLRRDAVPLVVVHGISRNAAELALRFGELAQLAGVPVIAPLFERRTFGMYQQVLDPAGATPCDEALSDILADASSRFGFDASRIDLFGFSGGAQFAHRYAMLHPQRVRTCVAAAAGWYTMPDRHTPWPLGLADAPIAIERSSLRRVRFEVIVGALDRQQDKALRRSSEIDAVQGVHRLQRARRWHRAMRKAGVPGSLTVIPGLSHAFGDAVHLGIVPLVFQLLGTSRAIHEEPAT
ncbi:hypothetical protein [Novosphingobium taihuense]|uniref:Pimeloyl-ACP methyl ester carboxylesterase n=1 Tax=Novosphingobium taihuense TaxID=260085 RepID=A0A7W7EU03_9SPHN|nr:hypothetical protein [Novosphingobium taihuense]MBB4613426.1 pimeloyl-ACP methyl ester carboxylesterase [Novosphingobium taihuense]TWH80932.1 esterase/PHB depolymerase [Novosphingobium taihuense]